MSGFDLDAALGELADKPLRYQGQEFTLPAELPAACLSPFLADDLGLIDLIADALEDENDDTDVLDLVFAALKKRPALPKQLLDAAATSLRTLMGDEQYAAFQGLRPSVNAYLLVARGILTEYGVGLGDFFGSAESSETGGENSKGTSSDTTESTSEAASEPTTPTSSESDA